MLAAADSRLKSARGTSGEIGVGERAGALVGDAVVKRTQIATAEGYRVDIDGLRGVAVALVCLFHADIALFSGGFIGVDVFFVISGFVITRVLLRDLENGRLSLKRFFLRRIRRLAPALSLVLLTCTGIFLLIYPPNYLSAFGASLLAQSSFVSNVYFWLTTGYFGAPPESKPLLHTWTLSVEEQFYLIFATVVVLSRLFKRPTLLQIIVVAFCLSLVASVFATIPMPNASFFLLPTRAWELLAGVLVALWPAASRYSRALSPLGANLVASLGLLLIAIAAVFYSSATPFPYIYASLPVGGAVALVWVNRPTIASSLLGWRPLVLLGKISYSLYLWHWVAVSIVCWVTFGAPTKIARISAILACIPISYVSWRFIETPIRQKEVLRSDRVLVIFAAAATIVTAIVGYLAFSSGGFPGRARATLATFVAPTRSPRERECFDDSSRGVLRFCTIGRSDIDRISFIAIGDSHALSLLPALDNLASKRHLKGLFAGTSGCLPFIGVTPSRDAASIARCRSLSSESFGYVRDLHIRQVILIARWSYYTGVGPDGNFQAVTDKTHRSVSVANSRAVFAEQLEATVNAYTKIGASVNVVLQVPLQRSDPEGFLFRESLPRFLGGVAGRPSGTLDLTQHHADQRYVENIFLRNPNIHTFDVASLLCPKSGTCLMFVNGRSMYFDDNHLSVAGALFVSPALDPLFARIEGTVFR